VAWRAVRTAAVDKATDRIRAAVHFRRRLRRWVWGWWVHRATARAELGATLAAAAAARHRRLAAAMLACWRCRCEVCTNPSDAIRCQASRRVMGV